MKTDLKCQLHFEVRDGKIRKAWIVSAIGERVMLPHGFPIEGWTWAEETVPAN